MPENTEKNDLIAALAAARSALTATVQDLTDEQLAAHPTASALCLGGLIKHVALIEEGWLRFAAGGPSALRYDLPEGVTWADFAAGKLSEYPQWAIDHQNAFRMLPGDTLAGIVKRYEEVAARTEEIIRDAPDLAKTQPLPDAPWNDPEEQRSVRRVVMHVIAETAQHAGHADIIRESLDGHTAG